MQILHYHYRKQQKISKTYRLLKNILSLSALLSILFSPFFCLPCNSFESFLFLDTVLWKITNTFKQPICDHFMLYIVSHSGLKMVLLKLILAKYHFLHKKLFTITSIYVKWKNQKIHQEFQHPFKANQWSETVTLGIRALPCVPVAFGVGQLVLQWWHTCAIMC